MSGGLALDVRSGWEKGGQSGPAVVPGDPRQSLLIAAVKHGIDGFVADPSPAGFERLVDRYLESPHFGKRWARHWMDVIHYAVTHGYEWDIPAKHAWRYRDYLVRAINTDVPFDRLVLEQIAGDLVPPRIDPMTGMNESLVGTMALRMGERWHGDNAATEATTSHNLGDPIDTLSKAFLGTTVGCARWRDSRSQVLDRLKAAPPQEPGHTPPSPVPASLAANAANLTLLADFTGPDTPTNGWQWEGFGRQHGLVTDCEPVIADDGDGALLHLLPAGRWSHAHLTRLGGSPDTVARRVYLELCTKDYDNYCPPRTNYAGFKAEDERNPRSWFGVTRVYAHALGQGPQHELGRFVGVLDGTGVGVGIVDRVAERILAAVGRCGDGRLSGRLEVARSIADSRNPFTARVFVNRVCLHVFGEGLVRTPDDFGHLGDRPTHPELLDFLALRFVEIACPLTHTNNAPWDQHGGMKKYHPENALITDQPVAALITDLKRRGLLDETLVLWTGEMGMGVVANPIDIHDIRATILHCLGIDHERLTFRFGGRDVRLTDVHGWILHDVLA